MHDTPSLGTMTRNTFLRLAEVLAGQPHSAWNAPSLCEAWSVREVVAHMTVAARYSPEQYHAEVQADGGDFLATIDRLAARDGRRNPDPLLGDLRSDRLHRWTPPGGGLGALTHVVIHGLDVTTPLGLDSTADETALRTVLDALADGHLHAQFGVDLGGLRVETSDMNWAWGQGASKAAPAADLVLMLSGRRLADDRTAP